jgi:hypothetical protein
MLYFKRYFELKEIQRTTKLVVRSFLRMHYRGEDDPKAEAEKALERLDAGEVVKRCFAWYANDWVKLRGLES